MGRSSSFQHLISATHYSLHQIVLESSMKHYPKCCLSHKLQTAISNLLPNLRQYLSTHSLLVTHTHHSVLRLIPTEGFTTRHSTSPIFAIASCWSRSSVRSLFLSLATTVLSVSPILSPSNYCCQHSAPLLSKPSPRRHTRSSGLICVILSTFFSVRFNYFFSQSN